MIQDTKHKIVVEVITAWDPIRLISGGAPLNEYTPKIRAICEEQIEAMTDLELAVFIQKVFDRFFETKPAALPSLKAAMEINSKIKMKEL